ncbi:MAG: HAMP domain-containing sensor histidine kinase [Anaerolineaceae bacterium]|nr:HAMP domain-containing sensor histidine kinase [Anaerolineaceae bacterium]
MFGLHFFWYEIGVLVLALLLSAFFTRKMELKPENHGFQQWLIFIVLAVLSFLFSRFLVVKVNLPAIPNSYSPNTVLFPVLSLTPAVLALGLLGLTPAMLLGIFSGVLLVLFRGHPLTVIIFNGAFLLLLAQKFTKPEERGKRYGATSRFAAAYLELLPILLLINLFLALLAGNTALNPLLQDSLNQWLSMLPALILGILIIHGVNLLSSLAWLPAKFLKANGSRKLIIDFATRQIENLAKGNLDLQSPMQTNSLQEEVLLSKIQELRNALVNRQDLVNRALSVEPGLQTQDGRDKALNALLESALAYGGDSARFLVFSVNPNLGSTKLKEKFALGKMAESYESMDAILFSRLEPGEKLMLTDLKAKQYFGIDDDLVTPRSLIAFTKKISEDQTTLFWIGFQENRLFNSRESQFYEALSLRTINLFESSEELERAHDQGAWLISAMDALPQAHFVLNTKNRLIFANKKGEALLSKHGNFFAATAGSQVADGDFLSFISQNSLGASSFSFKLGQRHCHAHYYPITDGKVPLGKAVQVVDAAEVSDPDRQKVQFLTNISHDLQSPLKLMRGYLLLLHNLGGLGEQQQKFLEKIHANVDNMDILTHKLLSLEELDSRPVLSDETVDIQQIINDLVSVLSLQASQKKLQILTDFSELKSKFINADRVLVQEAIFNILENAIKFSFNKSVVELKCWKDDDFVYVRVKDFGKGISLMDREKIFERFYRVEDNEGFAMRGQGLGLSIAKEAAEKHGGRIDLQSKLGEGSTFTFVLPLRNSHDFL